MNRRLATGLLIAACVVLILAAVWWLRPGKQSPVSGPEVVPEADEEAQTEELRLYFPGDGGLLYPETRTVEVVPDVEKRVQRVVEEVLAGPTTPGLEAPLPAGTRIRGVDLLGDHVAFVDLGSEQELPPSGSRREMLIAYSVVDSVVTNVESIERVGLVWNGIQRTTLAGHLDLTHPLPPNMDLVARRR